MHHYALIALLSATPNIDQTSAHPTLAPLTLAAYDEPAPWIDKLIFYLELLCDYIGPEFCPTESIHADTLMSGLVAAYEQHGVPVALPMPTTLLTLDVIEDLHAHVVAAEAGSQDIVDSMLDALESMYADLGGDPDNL